MIEMTHPDLPDARIEAVDEAQAAHLRTLGWVDADPVDTDAPEVVYVDTADGLENETLDDLQPFGHPVDPDADPDPLADIVNVVNALKEN